MPYGIHTVDSDLECLTENLHTVDFLKLLKDLLEISKDFLTIGILQGQRTQQLRFNC